MPRFVGVDLTPLRSVSYRRLYVAGLVTSLGQQASYVTLPYQLKQITHSAFAVGVVGLVEVIPLVVGGLYGGFLADAKDRRRVIITFELVLALLTGALVLNSVSSRPSTLVIYACAFALAAAGALQRPSIEALNQVLVSADLQRASATLANLRYTGASIVGPTVGGLVAVAAGPVWVYLANVATFLASLYLLGRLPHVSVSSAITRSRVVVAEGARYLRTRPDIIGTYVIDLFAMAWAYPVGMLPFVAAHYSERFALSALYVGLPAGALLATLTSRWTHRVHHYGRAIVASAVAWGVGIALFAVATTLPLALAGLALAGGADALSGVFRSTLWNESILPEIRGRMAGIEMISYSIGPTAGQFRAGAMTVWMSLRASLALGGIGAAASVGVVALALPSLWRFDDRSDSHVAEVRRRRSSPTPLTLYHRGVATTSFLVTVSGPDRVGCGAELWAALEAVTRTGGVLADVGQITIRGSLVLCADIVVPEDVTLEDVRRALAERDLERDGLRADVVAVHPEVHDAGGRLLVTLLAPRVGAEQLHRIFTGIASVGATCERIVHLAKYPVDAYELAVRGCDSDALRAAVTGAAQEVGVDLAVQRAGLHRRAKHLVVMDADSTLLQDEVIDLLAEACNCAEEVATITERAMAGELDFAASLRARVALLEGLPESVLDDVRQRLRLTPGARTLVRTLLRLGYVPAVVSGGFEEVLAPLLQELGVGLWRANRLEVRDGRLTGRVVGDIVDRAGKARALESFAHDVGVPLAQTVAVGDGANDIDMISVAGLGIAFNAKPVVRAHADTALSVPYLDAVLYFLGISREEIEDEALAPAEGA